jgi:hypothetical protein
MRRDEKRILYEPVGFSLREGGEVVGFGRREDVEASGWMGIKRRLSKKIILLLDF